jgi:hypothetical protein
MFGASFSFDTNTTSHHVFPNRPGVPASVADPSKQQHPRRVRELALAVFPSPVRAGTSTQEREIELEADECDGT